MPSSTASSSTAKHGMAMRKSTHSDLSAPPSLADLDSDLLRQILEFAQPTEHHHRFEWSGLVGRTCQVFHSLSQELSASDNSLVVDMNQFQKYKPVFTSRCRPRDVSLNFLCILLMKNDVARARIKEFHYNPGDLGKIPRRDKGRIANQYAKRRDKKIKPLLSALKSLFQQPNAFPNLTCLDIYRPKREYAFDLVDCGLFNFIPAVFPKLDHLCLGHCFDCSKIEPLDSSIMAMAVAFAGRLQTPLRSLSLMGAPWMTDDSIDELLNTIGSKLEVLELIDCSKAHEKVNYGEPPYDPLPQNNRTPLGHRSLEAVARHCSQLRYVRFVDVLYSGFHCNDEWREEDARLCNEAMVSVRRANPHLSGGFQNINYQQLYDSHQRIFGIREGTIYKNSDYMEWAETRFRGDITPYEVW